MTLVPSSTLSATAPLPEQHTQEHKLYAEAERIVEARGASSILEELSRPVIRSFPPHMLPHLSRAALEAKGTPLPIFRPLSAFLQGPSSFSTACSSLDELLAGGIPLGTGCIVELSGVAGAGKTQLALQLSLMAGMPLEKYGAGTGAVIAFTEGPPPVKRMYQIERALCQANGIRAGSLLDKVIVEQVRSVDQLLDWAKHRLPYLFRESGATVVVVDSVAAVYRPEFDDALSRAGHLVGLAAALKQAAADVSGVCICVNQVSQSVGFDGGLSNMVPALGAAWSNCVDTRVFLKRIRMGGERRFAKILHSSFVPCTEGNGAEYRVAEGGIVSD